MAVRRHQKGSVTVLVAGAMIAVLTMVALIFAAGTAYWARRHLQSLADTAALSGSLSIATACTATSATAAVNAANSLLVSELGVSSGAIASGGGCVKIGNFSYPGGVQSTITYPYNGDLLNIEVRVQQTPALQLATFIGAGAQPIRARAVARFLGGVPAYAFPVFASNQVSCDANSTVTVSGSIYAVNGITGTGTCRLVARAVKDPNDSGVYHDFGNMLVWAQGQSWNCPASTCADGYQLGGHTSSSCGTTATSQYLDSAELTHNPNPCGRAVPRLIYPRYFDPNTSFPNPAVGRYAATGQAGCDVAGTLDAASGYTLFLPGCYTTLDVTTTPNHKAALLPGFYYFGANGGAGLCLGGDSRVIGSDVTLEFTGNASMTSNGCALGGGCAAAPACGFGSDPALPPPYLNNTWLAAPGPLSSWCTGICPSRGLLVYYQNPTPGTGTGQFLLNGDGEQSWMRGTVFWQNARCEWAANGTGTIQGQIACKDVHLEGNAAPASPGVSLNLDAANLAVPEASLIE